MKTNFILILVIASSFSFCQGRFIFGDIPLQTGNIWFTGPDWISSEVLDTMVTIEDSLNYYVIHSKDYYGETSNTLVRLRGDNFYVQRMADSYPALNHEYKFYLKGAETGDTWSQPDPRSLQDTIYTTVGDTTSIYIFDQWFKATWLINDDNFWNFYQIWSDSLGIIYEEDDLLEIRFNLGSCVVNGTVYGDTTGLTDIAAENVLEDYRLEQNYPNPFNPTTTIGYQLPQSGFVSLKVFDILGREVTVLINQWEPSGYHSTDFSAEDLSSGIYFYRISVNDFISTKKMLLIK